MNYTEIQALASNVLGVLVQTAPTIVEGVTKGYTSGIGKDIWEYCKGIFIKPTEKEVLSRLEDKPQDKDMQVRTSYILESLISEDSRIETELSNLLKKAGIENPTISHNNNTILGNDNILVNDVKSSNIKINKNLSE